MVMEQRTFGSRRFCHIPARLFSDIIAFDKDGNKTIELITGGNDPQAEGFVEVCVRYRYRVPCGGGEVVFSCYKETEICESIYYDDDPPPIGEDDGGGGGGGGNGDPCPGNIWYNPVPNPCGGPPPPPRFGWGDSTIIPSPCAQADSLAKDVTMIQFMDSLRQRANDPNNITEDGYAYKFNPDNSMDYAHLVGEPGEAGIDVNVYQPIDGFMHNHYKGLLSIFSPDDIKTICTLYKGGNMVNPLTYTLMVVTAKNTQYLLKIADMEKFKNFVNYFLAGDFNDFKNTYNDWLKIQPGNSPAVNERRFLVYLKSAGGSGLKLFRGNSSFSKWEPLGLDENDNVIIDPCN